MWQVNATVRQQDGHELVDIAEAAQRLGTTPAAIRKRLERGRLRGRKVGGRWFVVLSSKQDRPSAKEDTGHGVSLGSDSSFRVSQVDDSECDMGGGALGTLHVSDLWERLDRMHRENLELAGRVGFYQAEIQQLRVQLERAESRILELEAPKGVPAEMSIHLTHLQDGADLGSEKGSPRPWWKFW